MNLFGCAATGGASAKIGDDGHLVITIVHPTGEYQPTHNIFKPVQESHENYYITLLEKGSNVEGNDVKVFKSSTLTYVQVSGSVESHCQNNKLVAIIDFRLEDETSFASNCTHDLKSDCVCSQ